MPDDPLMNPRGTRWRRYMGTGEWLAAVVVHPVFLIAVGGAVGSNLRYFLARWLDGPSWHGGFPWGTFAVNVSGSFLLGFFVIAFLERLGPIRREAYLLLGTGLCGGFTTFSTFEWEAYRLLREGNWPTALAYVVGSAVAGLLAVAAGVVLAFQLFERR